MTRATVVLAPVVFVALTLAGRPVWGIATAVGLLLGVVNTLTANRLVASGVPFLATSGLRLMVLTLCAFATALLFKVPVAVAFLVGVTLCQMALAVAAAMDGLRR